MRRHALLILLCLMSLPLFATDLKQSDSAAFLPHDAEAAQPSPSPRAAQNMAPLLLLLDAAEASISPPLYLVLFTHIEDNTPTGTLGTDAARSNYLLWRSRLIAMAELARNKNLPWVLQPDWKFLLAAQQYEDATVMASTGGHNVLRYLRDSLGVVIDPHSHEAGGYNYTDVA